jgi:hypothetical protein
MLKIGRHNAKATGPPSSPATIPNFLNIPSRKYESERPCRVSVKATRIIGPDEAMQLQREPAPGPKFLDPERRAPVRGAAPLVELGYAIEKEA